MSFQDDMAADLSAVFFDSDAGFSVPAIFEAGDVQSPTDVIINHDVMVELEDGQILQNSITIELQKAAIPSPKRGNTITAYPKNQPVQVYSVGDVISDDGGAVIVYVRKQ